MNYMCSKCESVIVIPVEVDPNELCLICDECATGLKPE